jgi:hypothetical protein
MSLRSFSAYSAAAFAGAAMVALSWGPASALTPSGPALAPPLASAQVDKVYYRGVRGGVHGAYRGGVHGAYRGGYRGGYAYRGGGYRGYGYGGAAIVGGAAAGLAVGAAVAAPHCWINAYGTQVCN